MMGVGVFLLSKCVEPIISSIYPNSIAEELGLEAGDKIIRINGIIIEDQIDFRFLQAEESLEIEIQKKNGETWLLDIVKDVDEELGIEFADATFDGIRACRNKCIFCFIDQMPEKLRDSLYVKDDDYRHSFLFGNFITLTNLKTSELEKIVKRKLSPLYVSIHTTNPEIRKKILNNKNASKILEQLQFLTQNGIYIHGQIVLVPGINDGAELKKTIDDLAALIPQLQSLAVVPVGLTKFRENLKPLKPFTKKQAAQVIDMLTDYQHKFLKSAETRFVFAADEFYVLADYEIPDEEFYEGFPQLENGVGIVRLFIDEFKDLFSLLPERTEDKRPKLLLTSVSGYNVIYPLVKQLETRFKDINIKLVPVINDFFGASVTVTGLLTGQDIINTVVGMNLPKETIVIIPDITLKDDYLFLDDLTVNDVQQSTGYRIQPVATSGKGLIEAVTGLLVE
jgi:putative radical SAM enzyme (TIGR03279 family)